MLVLSVENVDKSVESGFQNFFAQNFLGRIPI